MKNLLSTEKSPYLLQHKDNPVWWHAWSPKTLAKAKQTGKPVLLSIGYSTCHWCHVMEKESFEDQQVADLLNKNFVAIKVDREEHPDVDQIYMDAVHALGQRGGWPLNFILTPDMVPIYGGTYFPKDYFLQLLNQLHNLWNSDKEKVLQSSQQIHEFLKAQSEASHTDGVDTLALKKEIVATAISQLKSNYDPEWGGFGEAPKFPPQVQLSFIAKSLALKPDPVLQNIMEVTLQRMAEGGMYDHLGGGFARYSVDERWEIPHFEKMLYVNAMLVRNYLDAYQISKNANHLAVAEDVLAYMSREMLSSGNGFYSAEDADSLDVDTQKLHEGAYYVWSIKELQSHLSQQEVNFLAQNFGVSLDGNFEGKNNLRIEKNLFWEPRNHPDFKSVQTKLLAIREEKPRPLLDDKQLTSWNALAVTAFSQAARVTGKKEYLETARQALKFIKNTLSNSDGLLRRYRESNVDYKGTLDDYAYTIEACLEFVMASGENEWLEWAKNLQDLQLKYFEASDSGGFYYTQSSEVGLLIRTRDFGDGAIPNSNGVSALNLLRLWIIYADSKYKSSYEKLLKVALGAAHKYPSAFCTLLSAVLTEESGWGEQWVMASHDVSSLKNFWFSEQSRVLRERYMPFALFLFANQVKTRSEIPILNAKTAQEGELLFYVCEGGVCSTAPRKSPFV